jgi:transcription elongation GreA/GreB family factor
LSWFEAAEKKIEAKEWEAVEETWMSAMDADPTDVDRFMTIARALRKAGERPRADALLELLGDALKEKKAWPERLTVLRELGRLSKKPSSFREPLLEALHHTYADRPSYRKVLTAVGFDDPKSNPVEKAEKVETWLQYDQGEHFFMSGRGAGVVTELNAELGICRLDFHKAKKVSVPLGAAPKYLEPIGEGHVLRQQFESPEEFGKRVLKQPAQILGELLRSFGRSLTVGDVKDAMSGVVPESRWGTWWTAARKNPQVVVKGSGAKATYNWNDSTEDADDAIRESFEAAKTLAAKVDLARKHSARNQELADHMSRRLAEEAEKAAATSPALSWETFAVLEKLPGHFESSFNPDQLLAGPLAANVATLVSDRLLRVKALQKIRERNPDWTKVFSEVFFKEEDPRVMTTIVELLEESGEPDVKSRLVDETLRYPMRHPFAFYWYCKSLDDDGKVPDRGAYRIFHQLLDAIASDEFAPLRARLKDFFDKGALAVRIVMEVENLEEARKLATNLERYGQLEDYRREILKSALLLKYPKLREPEVEPVYATAAALAAKKQELDHLVKVEVPANSKAIQVAREMGDLRENFEYKAARQRAEYLAARVGEIQGEIVRVRVLNPAEVDTSQVRIGTKTTLRNGDLVRDVTILGPWESSPETGVYSNQSDVAKALLGHQVGDIVSFMGNDYEIEAIATWE